MLFARRESFTGPLQAWPECVGGYLSELQIFIYLSCFSDALLAPLFIHLEPSWHEWWHVWIMWDSILASCSLWTSYSPKWVNIHTRAPGSDLLVPQLPSVGKSMKRVRATGLPSGQSTSAQISTVLSPPFFLSSVRWDQKAQLWHISCTYTRSSHTNNHNILLGRATLSALNTTTMLKEKKRSMFWYLNIFIWHDSKDKTSFLHFDQKIRRKKKHMLEG